MLHKQPIDWEEYALCYDSLLALVPYRSMLNEIVAEVKICGAHTILDAGCGTGNLTALLTEDTSLYITGVDSSPEMLTRAKEKCASARFMHADLNGTLSFEHETFDTIVCVNALYIVENPLHTLKEFCRMLKYGGTLVIATPKHGYENGLILKAHCESEKPDAYWIDAHASIEREEKLVKEALGDGMHALNMLTVAAINRRIARTKQFHFFTAEELCEVMYSAGFQIAEYKETYAGQAHLFVTHKPLTLRRTS